MSMYKHMCLWFMDLHVSIMYRKARAHTKKQKKIIHTQIHACTNNWFSHDNLLMSIHPACPCICVFMCMYVFSTPRLCIHINEHVHAFTHLVDILLVISAQWPYVIFSVNHQERRETRACPLSLHHACMFMCIWNMINQALDAHKFMHTCQPLTILRLSKSCTFKHTWMPIWYQFDPAPSFHHAFLGKFTSTKKLPKCRLSMLVTHTVLCTHTRAHAHGHTHDLQCTCASSRQKHSSHTCTSCTHNSRSQRAHTRNQATCWNFV